MRLFKYIVHTGVLNSQSQPNYDTEGMVFINNSNLNKGEIKKLILEKLFSTIEDREVTKLEEIPQID